MNLEKYQELTGITIPTGKENYYKALIVRVQSKLETLLGYTLKPSNLYTELGKTNKECFCPSTPKSSTLLPPDPTRGIVKVFPYNSKDKFLHIDPFHQVYSVKLVRVVDNYQFITYKTFDSYTQKYDANQIGRHIEKCETCFCNCDCKDCVQLAVDADWVDMTDEDEMVPNDLLYLWCDMIDFYGDRTKDIQSESVDGHSWSKAQIVAPEETEYAKMLLAKYSGPFGMMVKVPTL